MVGSPWTQVVADVFEQSLATRVELDDGTLIHVVRNPPLEHLLFDRTIVGAEFEELCSRSTRMFLGHLAPSIAGSDVKLAELMILSKGIYYDLRRQYRDLFGKSLELNLIATKRQSVDGTDVQVIVPYHDYISQASTLIIGDTIASGATISAAIRHYAAQIPLQDVIVLSFAGAGIGAKAIRQTCLELGVNVHFLFALAAFGLGENGFDLSFLHSETITAPEYVDRAHLQFDGRPVSCVGWDFGSQAQAVEKYRALCWAESVHWGLELSDQFKIKEEPQDWSILEREASAFGGLSALKTRKSGSGRV
jgi:hypothetical protein